MAKGDIEISVVPDKDGVEKLNITGPVLFIKEVEGALQAARIHNPAIAST